MAEATPAAAPTAAPTPSAPAATPAPAAAAPAPAPAPAETKPDTITVKINGKLRNLTRDDAIRELQKGIASRETFEKAAAKEKRVAQIFKALQDPNLAPEQEDEYLRQLGRDPDKIAERRLALRAQQAQMTPEQKRIAELEARIQTDERSRAERDEQSKKELQDVRDREVWSKLEQEYTGEIDRAIKAGELGGMKPAEALFHMASAAEMNLEFGLQLSTAELLQEAKARVSEEREQVRSQALSLQGDALLEFLGVEAVNKVLSAAREKYKRGKPIQDLAKPAAIAPAAEPQKRDHVAPLRAPWL